MFTQPCFIRKNSKYLRDKLEELGYRKNSPSWTDKCSIIWCYQYSNGKGFNTPNYVIADSFDIPFDEHSALKGKFIDCGTNEDLFLAIAALRDDTDKNQWFVIPKIKTIRLHGCFGQTIGMDGHKQIIDGYKWHLSDEDGISKKIRSYVENGEDDKFLPHKATVEELIEHFK